MIFFTLNTFQGAAAESRDCVIPVPRTRDKLQRDRSAQQSSLDHSAERSSLESKIFYFTIFLAKLSHICVNADKVYALLYFINASGGVLFFKRKVPTPVFDRDQSIVFLNY